MVHPSCQRSAYKVVRFHKVSTTSGFWLGGKLCAKICSHQASAIAYRSFSDSGKVSDYGKYEDPGILSNAYQQFADSSWINYVECFLKYTHDFSCLPWSESILLSTFLMRVLVMSPLMVTQMRANVKHQQVMPALMKLDQELKAELQKTSEKLQWDETTKTLHYHHNFAIQKNALFQKHKVPGFFKRFMLPWVQIPLWFSMSVALRDLTLSLPFTTSNAVVFETASQLAQEGCLWFPNLCVPDPYFVLPLLFCCANLSVIEIYRGDGKRKLQGLNKAIIYGVRLVSIVMFPIACQMPSGVVLYWFYSSFYGVLQALLMRSTKVRTMLAIPVSPAESKTPYKDLLNRFLPTSKKL